MARAKRGQRARYGTQELSNREVAFKENPRDSFVPGEIESDWLSKKIGSFFAEANYARSKLHTDLVDWGAHKIQLKLSSKRQHW